MNTFLETKWNNKQYEFRKSTDYLFEIYEGKTILSGLLKKYVDFISNHQLYNDTLWDLFVKQFSEQNDSTNEVWCGEFFGKMARGACFIYKITKDEKLYNILKKHILDLIKTQDYDGRISSYKREHEFVGWDMWCRKYVMLAFEYFIEINDDEKLNNIVEDSLKKHADYIIEHIGNNKIDILNTSPYWGAINSASILEPFVKLYNLTRDNKYLDFAKYIISTGGCKDGNIITTAIENTKKPANYPVVKAYELMSFIDGLAEYYSTTKEKKYKDVIINFVDQVLENEFTIIGASGCTHELFDNSYIRQTTDQMEVMQETCVTVTLLKLLVRALELTDNPKYADCIEKSYYNAMLGSVNLNQNNKLYWGKEFDIQIDYKPTADFVKKIHGFTFDSYSPLYKNARCRKTGGYQVMDGNKAFGCCNAIGALGISILPLYSIMEHNLGLTINFLIDETKTLYSPRGEKVVVNIKTNYPYDKKAHIHVDVDNPEIFEIRIRIPDYVNKAIINGKEIHEKGYYGLVNNWNNSDIDIEFFYDIKLVSLNNKIALVDGLIVYAIDNRIDNIDKKATNEIIKCREIKKDINCNKELEVTFSNNETIKMVDYSSSGAIYDCGKNKITVWMDK